MNNWLEQAEGNITHEHDRTRHEDRMDAKKEAIQENYRANQKCFNDFLEELKELVDRVNQLPVELRHPFGKITYRTKKSSLDNHRNYVSSSQRYKKRMYRSVFRFFKTYTIKWIRVAYFTVSSNPGMIDIELKENKLPRVRMTINGEKERMRRNRLRNSKDSKDYRFSIKVEELSEMLSRDIIDWLAFKSELEEISLFNETH